MLNKITFESGKTTCAISPGNFCIYLRTKNFGTSYFCHLFEVPLNDKDGWLQRHPLCLQLTEEELDEEV